MRYLVLILLKFTHCLQMCLLQLYESNCCITKWKLRSNPLQQNLIGGFVFHVSLMFSSIHLLFSLCLVGYRNNLHTICFGSPTCTNPGCADAHRVYFSWYLSYLQDCFEIDIVYCMLFITWGWLWISSFAFIVENLTEQ